MRKFCIYSSFVLLISAFPIVFRSLFILPKVRADIEASSGVFKWGVITTPLHFPTLVLILGFVAFVSGIIGLVFSLKLKKWDWVREGLVAKLVGTFSLLIFVLSRWISLATWAGSYSGQDRLRARMSIYDQVIREFTLKAEADERIDEVRRWVDATQEVNLVEIEDVSGLSREDRRHHWISIHQVLSEETAEDTFDTSRVARLLATAGEIRNGDSDFSVGSRTMASFFNKLTGAEMKTDRMVFDWIEQRGKARWIPYKIYDVKIFNEG